MPLLPTKAERDVETFKVTTAGAVLQGGMPAEVRDVAKGQEISLPYSLYDSAEAATSDAMPNVLRMTESIVRLNVFRV